MSDTQRAERLLEFSGEMGKRLIKNGAEMYRVEESLQLILTAFGVHNVKVFAIPSIIMISFKLNDHLYAGQFRLKGNGINLERLEQLNALSRRICAGELTLEQSETELAAILSRKQYPPAVSYIAFGIVAFLFTLFWGGTLLDAAIAFPCGLVTKHTTTLAKRFQANLFFSNVLSGCFSAVLPILLGRFFPAVHTDMIIIGTIMLLVPGIAIANVMRDVLAGDTLTALTRLTEVLIVGVGVAVGIAIPLALLRAVL